MEEETEVETPVDADGDELESSSRRIKEPAVAAHNLASRRGEEWERMRRRGTDARWVEVGRVCPEANAGAGWRGPSRTLPNVGEI